MCQNEEQEFINCTTCIIHTHTRLPNDLSPLNRLSSWMYSLDVLNFKSNESNSMYSSPLIVTRLPFMSIDTFNPAEISIRITVDIV